MKKNESIQAAALPSLRPGISGGASCDGLPDLFPLRAQTSSPGNRADSPPGSSSAEPAVPGTDLRLLTAGSPAFSFAVSIESFPVFCYALQVV